MTAAANLQHARGLVERSFALIEQQQLEQALQCLNDALQTVPNLPSALVKRAELLQALGRHHEAFGDFEICLALSPKLIYLQPQRDLSLHALLAEIDSQLPASQNPAQLWFERAMLLMRARRDEDALSNFRQALATNAAHIDTLINMGNLLLRLNRHDESLACYERILELDADNVIALFNRGNVLQRDGQYRVALECYAMALARRPELAEAVMEQAHCHLALGELREGWRLFESRWNTRQLRPAKLATTAPMWDGETLDCAHALLLWAEQGLGDTLQFVRYLPMVSQRAAAIVLRVPSSLKTMLAHFATQLNSNIRVIENSEAIPQHAAHCPLMSLPFVFGSELDNLPVHVPYLSAPTINTEKWKTALGARSKARIGIVWAGGQRLLNNPTRDMQLESMLPLFDIDAQWIGLQQSMSDADSALLAKVSRLDNVGDQLVDFGDTAGLIEQLDLLISIDSSVAHLAGALGKPVWLLLRKSGEWRWMRGRDDSPWYPQHRLLRQQQHGDWRIPVQQAIAALPQFIAELS